MLSRGNSTRTSHRKSASITSEPSTAQLNPDTARQQAKAAAAHAFAKAMERHGDVSGVVSGNSMRQDENTKIGRSHSVRPNTRQDERSSDGALPLKRQQSVRFVGATAKPKRALGTRAQDGAVKERRSTATMRPQLKSNSAVPPVPSLDTAAYMENYAREEDLVSTPSSYRRLRRSKSVMHPGAIFGRGTPEGAGAGERRRLWGSKSSRHLRAPKSMGFLRGGRTRESDDAELRERPSFLSRANKKEDKALPRSVRQPEQSSTNSYGIPYENQAAHGKDGALRSRARQASQTIKNKLKGLFRRIGNTEEAAIPDQEVQAKRKQHTDYEVHIGPPTSMQSDFDDAVGENATFSRVRAHQPEFRPSPDTQLRSMAGSMQSPSASSESSRVPSWSNSEGTMNSRHAAAERERQRLSIISENGPHSTSSSFPRAPLRNQHSPYPQFHLPRNGSERASSSGNGNGHLQAPSPRAGPVNSPELYEALMGEIDKKSPRARQRDSVDVPEWPAFAPPYDASMVGGRSSGGSEMPVESPGTVPQNRPAYYVPARGNDTGSVGYKRGGSESSASTIVRQPTRLGYPPPVMGNIPPERSTLSPQEIALRKEQHTPSIRAVRQTRSTFFGSSEIVSLGRKTSPYRRALTAERNSASGSSPLSAMSSPFPPEMQAGTPRNASGEGLDAPYTDSLYSRTTSGEAPWAREESGTPEGCGSVRLIGRETYASPMGKQREQRVESGADSQEWKAWMGEQIAGLETPHAVPRIGGHVRENAQIGGVRLVERAQSVGDEMRRPSVSGKTERARSVGGGTGIVQQRNAGPGGGRSGALVERGASGNAANDATSAIRDEGASPARSRVKSAGAGMENRNPLQEEDGHGHGHGRESGYEEEWKKHVGSQRMVDLFLSSRRRRVAGSEEDGAFL